VVERGRQMYRAFRQANHAPVFVMPIGIAGERIEKKIADKRVHGISYEWRRVPLEGQSRNPSAQVQHHALNRVCRNPIFGNGSYGIIWIGFSQEFVSENQGSTRRAEVPAADTSYASVARLPLGQVVLGVRQP